MPKKPQVIAGQIFPTKKSLQNAIKQILHQSPLNQNLANGDFHFIRALLDRHPDIDKKIGCGVKAIRVTKFKPYNKRGFELVRLDDTKTDFSYIQCLRPESKLAKVKRAFRYAISSDIIAFKNDFFAQDYPLCELSGQPVTTKTCDVDHAPPMTFKNIFEKFIKVYGINIDKIALSGCGVDGSTTYDIEHPTIKDLWIQFHKKEAMLRILHKEVHRGATMKSLS